MRPWHGVVLALALNGVMSTPAGAQTAYVDFNTPGQYAASFNPWNDAGGTDGGNYAFQENPTNGVGGSGCVNVFQSSDTTAAFKTSSWDFSTNGAAMTVSVLIKANGSFSGDKVQLGFMNGSANGLNNNAGVAFESYRLFPQSGGGWTLHEQFHSLGGLTDTTLGSVSSVAGRWYKFVVSLTNTAGASGNYSGGSALYDYGTDGLTPGTNLVTFSTAISHTGQTDITVSALWPALRAFQDAGIDAWDDFLVYTPASKPVFTLPLTNIVTTSGKTLTLDVLADGPGTIGYSWFTNGALVSGAHAASYTTPPLNNSYTNLSVVSTNGNGSTTSSATVAIVAVQLPGVTNVAASGIQSTSATLNGRVTSTGNESPTITLFYGPTDGLTDSNAWAASVSLGTQSGSFAQTVSNLISGGTYYFRARAQNSAGTVWASPSLSFVTTILTVATVTNLPATGVQATFATLNGQVLSTGGDTPSITLYYGVTDGATNAAAWGNSVVIGAQTGAFAQTISGLSSNQLYYFTCSAANSVGTSWATSSQTFTTAAQDTGPTLAAVLTYHNDNTRQGVNPNETTLTPSNVNSNSFGRLFSRTLDGYVYAQPLIMTNVSIPGKGSHNVVYVATEHNSVYAFDADDASGANASPLWQISFLGPGVTTVPSGDTGTSDITPEVGITSTPVIDPVSGTIYFEVKTKEGVAYVHRLHALDIRTGLEQTNFNSPSVISCSNYPGVGNGTGNDNDGGNPPHVLWNPLKEHCRPALTLLNGVVYLSFASHGDNQPYHGWFFAYNATNVSQQLGVYNATPNGLEGGFWDGGDGPTVDPQGNLYLQTGNGTFDGGANITTSNNYSMSVLKLATTNGLSLVDYFAPANAVALSGADQDLGSSGPMVLPDSAGSAAHPHLLVGGGKTAPIYLIDRDNMGRFNGTTGTNKIVQQFNGGPGGDRDVSPTFFNNTLYIIDFNSRIGAYQITNALFNTTPVESPDTYDNKGGASVSISANGTSNAIAWAIYNSGGNPTTPCILRAYDASNLTKKLYSSDQVASRDSAGDAVKFTLPTIANGMFYVVEQYSLAVYVLAGAFVDTPVISPNGGIFTNSVTVSISDATTGAAIYYTLDGSAPTTNSILYAGPFVLTASAAITAQAFKPGSVASGTTTASFINSSAIGTGTGLLGQYWANTTSAAFTNAGFNAAPTLTRVDPTVDFNWSTTPPAGNIGPNTYVVRWTGAIEPQFSQTYTFSTTTDDGTRLWINGQLLIDEWVDQAPTTWSGSITLVAQQRYNIQMDFYQNGGGSQAQLFWSSPSIGPMTIIPQTQLYSVSNPPPVAVLTAPVNGSVYTATASVTISANAGAQFNDLQEVDFYANNTFLAAVSNAPYTLTATGLGQGSYNLMAVARDATGVAGTSAPVNITVTAGTGQPYGVNARVPLSPFLNMPTAIDGALPALLSQTGVFTNTAAMGPLNGLLPYDVNVPLWSDGAVKTRWMSVPNSGAPYGPDEQVGFAPTGEWTFPVGTIFVKHFDLVTDLSNPNGPKRRLETRLLVQDQVGSVYGVTYKWRADNSDADLLSTSLSEDITITNGDHTTWTQTWYYPSPADCLSCHTPAANYVLGVKTRQLNKSFTYPSGVTDNELRSLNHAGLFNPAFSEASIAGYDHLSSLTNTAASLQERARSYLDANCAQCHRPGGPGVTIDARYDTPLTNQNIINALLIKGDLGIDNARVVVPKDIWRSILYARMNTVDPNIKMPDLARNLIDTNAVQVMGDWIDSLPGVPALAPPTIAPPGGTFTGPVLVTLQQTNAGATLFFTLDGTLPDTNSFLYNAPFLLTNSALLSVNAFAPGFNNSIAVSDAFTILPGISFTAAYLSNSVFTVQMVGATNKTYVLQGSTDFINWSPVNTNVPLSTPFLLVDPSSGSSPYRFYRAVQQP